MDDDFDLEEATPPPVEEGAPTWVVTFGDMMSLLLTFFILMFSMSELKMDRFMLAAQSMREAVGGTAEEVIEDPMGLMPDPVDRDLLMQNPAEAETRAEGGEAAPDLTTPMSANSWLDDFTDAYLQTIAERLVAFIDESELHELIVVIHDVDGVHLRIQAMALFDPGVGVVAGENAWILGVLSEVTTDIDIPVVVSGHADNQPISNSQFASNWELSAVRAAGVARALVGEGQDPEFVRVESYGEYSPIADNSTREGRAENRRVELFYARQDVMEWARGIVRSVPEGARFSIEDVVPDPGAAAAQIAPEVGAAEGAATPPGGG